MQELGQTWLLHTCLSAALSIVVNLLRSVDPIECLQGTNADSSMLGNRKTHKLSARQRRALFNDFTLTIPFGGLNCVTGFISLRFKVMLQELSVA